MDLHGCNVYVLDHTAQVQVDDCKNCNFFLGGSTTVDNPSRYFGNLTSYCGRLSKPVPAGQILQKVVVATPSESKPSPLPRLFFKIIIKGPCKGSVFFRDCSDCTAHVAARQFRTRDVHNMKFGELSWDLCCGHLCVSE